MTSDKPEHMKLHETAALLRGAADSLEGFLSDTDHVMRQETVAEIQRQIDECRRVAGAKLRMARIKQARTTAQRTKR